MHIVLSAITFTLMVAALVDIIRSDAADIRNLPKFFWIVLVIILPFIGSVLWFVLGRERSSAAPLIPRPASTAPAPPVRTLSTEEQIAALDREIAEYEELQRIKHLEQELREREQGRSNPDENRSK